MTGVLIAVQAAGFFSLLFSLAMSGRIRKWRGPTLALVLPVVVALCYVVAAASVGAAYGRATEEMYFAVVMVIAAMAGWVLVNRVAGPPPPPAKKKR